jgi:glycosyltransferase involved in cell wall biosynthesis
MVNVLILPHGFPHNSLKVRFYQIVRELALDERFNVYLLMRPPSSKIHATLFILNSFKGRIKPLISHTKRNKINLIKCPFLYGPVPLFTKLNDSSLRHIIEEYNINVVINEFSHSLAVPHNSSLVHIYDFADDYLSFHRNIFIRYFIKKHLQAELLKCDLVTAASMHLACRLKRCGWLKNFIWIPNGLDKEDFEKVSEKEIKCIREKYNLEGKFVIGHIGAQDKYSGLDFLLQVFNQLIKYEPKMALLIVGPFININSKRIGQLKNVIITGPVSPEKVPAFFKSVDIGVLPYKPEEAVHGRFPIRMMDFTAARKIVVSWPFGDLKTINLPNIILAERSIPAWVKAILSAMDMKWKKEWDYLLDEFSWQKIVSKLKEEIFKLLDKKAIKW